MTPLAKGLIIILIPHQSLVTSMRNYMIHNRSLHIPSVSHAPHTQRMLAEISSSHHTPTTIITTALCRRSVGVEWLVLFTVSLFREVGTAGTIAGALGFAWHNSSLGYKKSPCRITPTKAVYIICYYIL
jgi:hypothetical protein